MVDAGARSFSERPLLPQSQAPFLPRNSSNKTPESEPSKKNQKKPQAQMPPGLRDPLYSLSSASIRARKNALEMENIQRASHLYSDYIGKIKNVLAQSPSTSLADASSTGTSSASPDPPSASERSLGGFNMDVDMQDQNEDTRDTPERNGQAKDDDLGEDPLLKETMSPLQALRSMARSGLLHSLVQQYFTLIHPQFMILHKNHFLVRFWADYGPFPEAHDIHVHIMHNQEDVWTGPIESRPPGPEASSDSSLPLKTNPLLLLAMLALVSRHIPDRTSLKSTAEERTHRLEQSLRLVSVDFLVKQPQLCHKTPYEAHLHQLMETDELGQDYAMQENLRDRGEQYFQWALQFLKSKYEDPSLTVVQSLLLLREYAIMAGYHSQAYMYGGNAITMAMQMGWHHEHSQSEDNNNEIDNDANNNNQGASEKGQSEAQDRQDREQDKDMEKQADNKATDEEQKLCWWHCFIVDRWMSAAYNRPVVILLICLFVLTRRTRYTFIAFVSHVLDCSLQYNRTFLFLSLTRLTCGHFPSQSPRGPCPIMI